MKIGIYRIIKKSLLAGFLLSLAGMFFLSVSKYHGLLVGGICFGVGLFLILQCDARLFTGSILFIRDLWDKECSRKELAISWILIWLFNLCGSILMSGIALELGFDSSAVMEYKATTSNGVLFLKAILCNFMVCAATDIHKRLDKTTTDTFFNVLTVVPMFVVCGFEHSVANMFYIPVAWGIGTLATREAFRILIVTTFGNVLGGIMYSFSTYEND